MNDLDPREISNFQTILDFFHRHPPLEDAFFGIDRDIDEGYSAAIDAAFPNAGDRIVSVGEVTRRKVMILGLEIVGFDKQIEAAFDTDGHLHSVWYTPEVLVRLPDGKTFGLRSADDLAELRKMLNLPLEPPAKDADKAS